MEQRRWRLIADESTKSSASRPMVPRGVTLCPVGLCCTGVGLPGQRARDRMLRGGLEIDRTAGIGPRITNGLGSGCRSGAFGRPLCTPYDSSRDATVDGRVKKNTKAYLG